MCVSTSRALVVFELLRWTANVQSNNTVVYSRLKAERRERRYVPLPSRRHLVTRRHFCILYTLRELEASPSSLSPTALTPRVCRPCVMRSLSCAEKLRSAFLWGDWRRRLAFWWEDNIKYAACSERSSDATTEMHSGGKLNSAGRGAAGDPLGGRAFDNHFVWASSGHFARVWVCRFFEFAFFTLWLFILECL